MNGHVLVTGGAGFLGRHLAERLEEQGLPVRLLDVAPGPATGTMVGGDVRDAEVLQGSMRGARAVVHAAFAPPGAAVADIFSVNVDGARAVLDAARTTGCPRVVLVSSTIVLRRPRRHPVLSSCPLSRLDAYRRSRVAAEALAARFGQAGLSVAVARPKTFVAPGRVGAFQLMLESIRSGRAVPVLGPGTNRYQLCDTRDLADGLARLALSDARGLFSFGAGEFGTVREDLQALVDHAGTGTRLRFLPARAARVALRAAELAGLPPGSEWHWCTALRADSIVDISRAGRELGWRPRWSNAAALSSAYDWYAETARNGSAPAVHRAPAVHHLAARVAGFSRSSRSRPS